MLCRCYLRWCPLSAFLLGAIWAQTVCAQIEESAVATLHEEARSVVVHVVVTSKDGKAVPGLTRQDFKVLEDGKLQNVSFFEQHAGASTGVAPAQSQRPLPPDTFTNIPAAPQADSVNVLLLDGLNTTTVDQMLVRKGAAKYLATIAPGIRIAVFSLNLNDRLRILQGFTDDSVALHKAVDHMVANPDVAAAASNNANGTAPSILGQGMNTGDVAKGVEQGEANYRAELTLESLQQMARYLAGIPGRKNLLWFTSYNPMILSPTVEGNDAASSPANPHGDSSYYEMSKKTVNMLANAQVSVYPIEASGVATDSVGDTSTVPTSYEGKIPAAGQTIYSMTLRDGAKGRNVIHLTMDQLAHDTGGKAVYNDNSLAEALAEDIDNGARYYTLAYTPTNLSAKGNERKIEVKLAGLKYNLAYRRSYLEDDPKQKKVTATAKDPLRSLMDRGMPDFTELRYQTHIVPLQPQPASAAARAGDNAALKPPVTRYGIDFTLATDNLSLVAGPDSVRRGKIEVAIVAYSKDGRPLNWMTHFVGLVVRPDQYAMARSSGIPFHLDIDAPPGDVYLRSGIYDTSSGKAGTLEIPLSAVTLAQR